MADGNGAAFGGRMSRVVEEYGFEPWTQERATANNLALDRLLLLWEKQERMWEEDAGRSESAYAKTALQDELAILAGLAGSSGGRNTQLNTSAFNLGQLVGANMLSRSEVETALAAIARAIGCDDDDLRAIRNGLDAGIKKPRKVPGDGAAHTDAHPRVKTSASSGSQTKMKPGETVVVRASTIEPRQVEWLWPGRIPLGKLTTFAGVGGLGKTFVLCDITARVTRGLPWPDSGGECCQPGQVLFISGEDDPDDTLVPRMIELGADLDQVCFLTTEAADKFTLADLPMLDAAMEQAGGNVRFVAIDPPTAYLGGINDHKNAELRSLLSPLKTWAQKHRVAVVFNTHVNKPQGAKVDAMMRVMGSVAWVNAVRAAHMFARDPDDSDRRLCVPMKNNLGPERKGLAYRLAFEPGQMAKVEWLGEVDTTADEAMNNTTDKPRKVVASEWLVERFREKRSWASDDLFRAAKEDGISRSAVFEAKRRLDLPKARKVTGSDGAIVWHWWVPQDWEPLGVHEPNTEPLEPVEPLGPQETAI